MPGEGPAPSREAAATALDGLMISDRSTVRDAMVAITANGREVVLVRDGAGSIVGLITDGDIRRGLLSGSTLGSRVRQIMTRDFVTIAPRADRAAVLDFMKARTLRHVPVLDAERRLVAMHFLRDLIGATVKSNVAVVMCGGKGSRLGPITETTPKPMVEVAGRPMLERIVLHLVGHGVRTIYLAVNFMAEMIERHFGDGGSLGCRIEYLREPMPLGTAGALSLLPQRGSEPLLVLNGDLITHADLTALLDTHVRSNSIATVAIGPHHVRVPFATVIEKDGRLLALEEKPTLNLLVNRGIYVLDPAALDFVPRNREFPMTALLDALLKQKKNVGVFYFEESWIDVGVAEDLRRARGLLAT